MIFAGFGNKAKVRGEVFYPCFRCERMATFALLETYGYGSLYGVRLAKVATKRLLVCSFCQGSIQLDRSQWETCRAISNGLAGKRQPGERDVHECVLAVAQRVFPGQLRAVRELMDSERPRPSDPALPVPPRRLLGAGDRDWIEGEVVEESVESRDDSSPLDTGEVVDLPPVPPRPARTWTMANESIPPPPPVIPPPPPPTTPVAPVDRRPTAEAPAQRRAAAEAPAHPENRGEQDAAKEAVTILRERLASGEIDVATYREVLLVLGERPGMRFDRPGGAS